MKRLLLLLIGFQFFLCSSFLISISVWGQDSLPEDEDLLLELDLESLMDIEIE